MLSKGGTSPSKHKSSAQSAGGRKRGHGEGPDWRASTGAGQSTQRNRSEIYSLVTSTDLALLATLIHDAIGHLMNAIDKAAKVQEPIDQIADAMEATAAHIKSVVRCRGIGQLAVGKARGR